MIGRATPDPDRVAEVLESLQALPPGERSAAAAGACAGDEALLVEVRSLLSADRSLVDFLRDPAPRGEAGPAEWAEGEEIGPYRLVAKIGEGGFGVVYRAHQAVPVRREVALKIIKPGMETDRVIARFEAERQALAMMDHPGIARVFDAGTTGAGRPYFAMELVDGEPITAYCDRGRLGVRDRLGLFVEVCRAVQHAHQKGVIHRDIKPTNVLVTGVDGSPVPKVIDFGIAKAIDVELTTRTFLTEQQQLVGTPAYMSPEQAAMAGLDMDTRCDIYSLGVLLYELLTGTAPFDTGALLTHGLVEMLRVIREEEPQRPSARLAALGRTGEGSAPARRTDTRRLGHTLRGDLDWIVMRCLEKERARRYQSAGDLAEDVLRHLRDQPVVAGPPSAAYRLHKFAKRHRGSVAAGSVIAALVLSGVVGMAVALAKLDERAGQLQRVADFQAEQLGAINPEVMGEGLRRAVIGAAPEEAREALGRSLAGVNFTTIALGTLEEQLFERTERAISERFADQPLVRAQLLETQAKTLATLGLQADAIGPQEEALRLWRAALGERDPRTIRATAALGALYCEQGRVGEGEPLLRAALELHRRVLGDDARETIETLNALGGVLVERGELVEAESLIGEALGRSRRVLPGDDAELLRGLNNLATLRQKQGRFEEALVPQEEAVAGAERSLGPDEWATMVARNNLASLLFQLGRLDEAEPQFRGVLRTRRRVLGDDHPDTLLSINNLGVVLERLGGLEEAQSLHLEAYEGRRRRLGDDHAFTLSSLNNLGSVYKKRGMLGEAEGCYRGALEGLRRALGDEHPYTLMATGNLAGVEIMRGDHAGAVGLLEWAVPIARRVWTGDNTRTYATMLADLGAARGGVGAFGEGEKALIEAYSLLVEGLGPDHETTRWCAGKLAALYGAWHGAEATGGHDAAAAAWRAKAD